METVNEKGRRLWSGTVGPTGPGGPSGPSGPSGPTGTGFVSGLIVMWHGTIASIPAGYVICDGNNSTPNLLAKFVEGVATAGTNPGATGGSVTHQHTISMDYNQGLDSGSASKASTTGLTDGRPPYYDVAFIMKT